MIALDTNILVYARRKETPHHPAALKLLRELAEGDTPWALPWPCVYEFLRVVTHHRVFDPPTPVVAALEDLDQLLTSPLARVAWRGPGAREALPRGPGSGALRGEPCIRRTHCRAVP